MHVKCTYNGVQLSKKEFLKNWLTNGIQIKILFPFRLKPWHKSKLRPPNKDPIKKEGTLTQAITSISVQESLNALIAAWLKVS